MSPKSTGFHSVLHADILAFLAHKRAVGRKYETEEESLRLLDRFLVKEGVIALEAVSSATIDRFLTSRSRPNPRSFNHLLGVVRSLFNWMVQQERIASSPVETKHRRKTSTLNPFIFDDLQIGRLLQLAAALPDSRNVLLRGPIYHTVFALLCGLGLRVGEVSRLCVADYDQDRNLLNIRNTKFAKSRLVPFGPKLDGILKQYLSLAERGRGLLKPDAPLFSFFGGRPINRHSIGRVFHELLPALNLDVPNGSRSPRPHDLRHTFAVGTLLKWYRKGIDPSKRLLHLSTFLGHVHPDSTAVYLTITDDLFREAGDRFERFAAPVCSVVMS